LYFCTSKASKLSTCGLATACRTRRSSRCQYLYFCTSKASKLSTCGLATACRTRRSSRCQYLYFCTSKASKLSTRGLATACVMRLGFESLANARIFAARFYYCLCHFYYYACVMRLSQTVLLDGLLDLLEGAGGEHLRVCMRP
jgi:hypothetical protein